MIESALLKSEEDPLVSGLWFEAAERGSWLASCGVSCPDLLLLSSKDI
jgi:hypothetical protein